MRICVFCGSSSGAQDQYALAAAQLGTAMAEAAIGLVYGGGKVGLMGVIADAVLAGGGQATGIIPTSLWEKEVGHSGLSELHIVDTMHQRKAMMADLADAFVAMPGGIGTLEELFEVWTWAQLGIHQKAIALLNVGGYFDPLLQFIQHARDEGFVGAHHASMLIVEEDPKALLERLQHYQPVRVDKWLEPDQT